MGHNARLTTPFAQPKLSMFSSDFTGTPPRIGDYR